MPVVELAAVAGKSDGHKPRKGVEMVEWPPLGAREATDGHEIEGGDPATIQIYNSNRQLAKQLGHVTKQKRQVGLETFRRSPPPQGSRQAQRLNRKGRREERPSARGVSLLRVRRVARC